MILSRRAGHSCSCRWIVSKRSVNCVKSAWHTLTPASQLKMSLEIQVHLLVFSWTIDVTQSVFIKGRRAPMININHKRFIILNRSNEHVWSKVKSWMNLLKHHNIIVVPGLLTRWRDWILTIRKRGSQSHLFIFVTWRRTGTQPYKRTCALWIKLTHSSSDVWPTF